MNSENIWEKVATYICKQCGKNIEAHGLTNEDGICNWCKIPEKQKDDALKQTAEDLEKYLNKPTI